MHAARPGVLAGRDVEALHKLRVSIRRIRSLLKASHQSLPDGGKRFAEDFRWLGAVTTHARDLDVFAGWLAGQQDPDLQPLLAAVDRQRAAEAASLRAALSCDRYDDLVTAFGSMLDAAPGSAAGAGAPAAGSGAAPSDPAAGRAELIAALRRADRRVVAAGATLTAGSPDAEFHDLRKRAKALRYLLDAVGRGPDTAAFDALHAELKALQDTLGVVQDTAVQRDLLRRLSAGERDAAGQGAAERLAQRIELRGREARSAVPPGIVALVDRGRAFWSGLDAVVGEKTTPAS